MRRKQLIIRLGAAALFVALALFLALVFFLRHHYAKTLAAKIWPRERYTITVAGLADPRSKTVLLIGDSRIADWGLPQIEGWRVLNAGLPGATTAELASCCRDILTQVQPQVVVLQVGINDLKLLGVQPELGDKVIGNCVSNILTVVAECRRAGAGVIVTPVWPAGKITLARRLVWGSAVDPAIVETDARLRRLLANMDGAYVEDFWGELTRGLSAEERNRLYRNTLHLQPETYARLTALLSEALKARVGNAKGTMPFDAEN